MRDAGDVSLTQDPKLLGQPVQLNSTLSQQSEETVYKNLDSALCRRFVYT